MRLNEIQCDCKENARIEKAEKARLEQERLAKEHANTIKAVVSIGGRPYLAEKALPDVKAPTLLIVGGEDYQVIEMNQFALDQLKVEQKELKIVPGATHLFEEPGTLEEVANLTG